MAKVAAKGAEARQGVEAEQAWNGRGSRETFFRSTEKKTGVTRVYNSL